MKGIDVSTHQGVIDWKKVKKAGIEFAMLRIGYSNVLDKQFTNNVKGCIENKIPFGVYLFSYALTVEDAIEEAEFVIKEIALYDVEFPIAFDLEGDTLRYMKQLKVTPTKELINNITMAFCNRIEKAGYYCMNYSNKDYYINWFNDTVKKKYDFWIAHWDIEIPFITGGIWQHTSTGKVDGIKGTVDMNIANKNYPVLIREMGLNWLKPVDNKIPVDWKAEYDKLIRDIEALIALYK